MPLMDLPSNAQPVPTLNDKPVGIINSNLRAAADPKAADMNSDYVPKIGHPDFQDLIAPNYDLGDTHMTRHDGSRKGNGYFGNLRVSDGVVATEVSIKANVDGKDMDIPSLVPTLTRGEVDTILHLKRGDTIPDEIKQKAIDFARQRMSQGKSPYASPEESPDQRTIPTQ